MARTTTTAAGTKPARGGGKSSAELPMGPTIYTKHLRLSLDPKSELSEIFSTSISHQKRLDLARQLRNEITRAIFDVLYDLGELRAGPTKSPKETLPNSSSDDSKEDLQW